MLSGLPVMKLIAETATAPIVSRTVGGTVHIRLRRNRQNDMRMPVQRDAPEVIG